MVARVKLDFKLYLQIERFVTFPTAAQSAANKLNFGHYGHIVLLHRKLTFSQGDCTMLTKRSIAAQTSVTTADAVGAVGDLAIEPRSVQCLVPLFSIQPLADNVRPREA